MKRLKDYFSKYRSRWLILPTVILLGAFFLVALFNNIHTTTYDISRFSIANETIRSPITIEDEKETERKIREAVQSVRDRYNISDEITMERINYVLEIKEAIRKYEELNEQEEIEITDEEKLEQLNLMLSDHLSESVKDETLLQLLEIPLEDRESGMQILTDALEDTLSKGVRMENKQTALLQVQESIKYSYMNDELKAPLIDLSNFLVVENSFFDVEETMEARKEAASGVEPVVINAGEVIVRDGQTITNEIYENLELVGLLDGQQNVFPVLGAIILILLICSTIASEMYRLKKVHQLDRSKIITIVVVTVLAIVVMKLVSLMTESYTEIFYIVPIATFSLLLKLLINERTAVIFAIIYSILASIIFNGEITGYLNAEAAVYMLGSQLASLYFLMNVKDRTTILKSGIGIMMVNLMVALLFIFLSFGKYAIQDLMVHSIFAIISAFLSAVLTIGLLSIFETTLNMLTDVKLLQLSNPNQPLLKKLLTEAPGTYHHSVMVANLSETACEAIGGNGLLARVGAYYHDIGKTFKPQYFIENQLSIRNPHDFMSPKESADIIINHPYQGADYLKKHKMPKEIIDIAREHHGTSLLKYFYYKAKEQDEKVTEQDFRYPGPKPQSKEAAIICICDSVEAAVRSLKEPTEESIEKIVSSIINDRMADGQLDESPLTLKEIKVIQNTINSTLKGIFHSRIQYPQKEAN